MELTWYGLSCFRLRGRSAAVVTDPYSPALGLKLAKLDADLITISHHHPNHNFTGGVKSGRVIDGPGEYEVSGVSVLGVHSAHDDQQGDLLGHNTIYVIELDEVRVCHLGDLGHRLDDKILEGLADIDVLLVPAGGGSALDATRAAEVVRQIEPRCVVPMHYALAGMKAELEGVDRFLKEMGAAAPEVQGKLVIQAAGGDYETRTVVLEARV
ncbi:MAG: MBL fold metallo-hydrolase [Candidatus Dormibacteraceae bacterium]